MTPALLFCFYKNSGSNMYLLSPFEYSWCDCCFFPMSSNSRNHASLDVAIAQNKQAK